MRLTFKFSTAGAEGFMSLPLLAHDGGWYASADGSLDEAKVRRELGHHSGVMFSAKDDRLVLALAVEFLDRTKTSMQRLVGCGLGVSLKLDGERATSSERRMGRGKFASVRVDVSRSSGGVRVALSVSNPNGAVGDSEAFAAMMARTFADTWTAIRDDLGEGAPPFRLVDGEGCAGAFAGAPERLRVAAADARRAECPNRHGGYCAPISPACPCYRDGRCVEIAACPAPDAQASGSPEPRKETK